MGLFALALGLESLSENAQVSLFEMLIDESQRLNHLRDETMVLLSQAVVVLHELLDKRLGLGSYHCLEPGISELTDGSA